MERALELFDVTLFTVSGTPVTPATLATVVATIALTFFASWAIRRGIRVAFTRRGVADDGTILAMARLVHYLVMFAGLGVAVQTIGIDLSTLFAAGAVFAVGLGFAMKAIAENFVSGVILLAERTITAGDILKVEGHIVRVEAIGIRATILKTRDGEELIMPNGTLVQSAVVNYTLRDSWYRVRVPVGVTYASDMKVVESVVEETTERVRKHWGAPEYPVEVFLADFGNSAVVWEAAIWVKDPWRVRRIETDLRKAIWDAFKDRGITIAFPQVDVHLDPPVEGALRALAGG